MKLPMTVLPVVPAPFSEIPDELLPEITLRAPVDVPPMVLPVTPPVIQMPRNAFGIAAVPAALVPMRLPATMLLLAPESKSMPSFRLPETTLPLPAVDPPIVLPLLRIVTP